MGKPHLTKFELVASLNNSCTAGLVQSPVFLVAFVSRLYLLCIMFLNASQKVFKFQTAISFKTSHNFGLQVAGFHHWNRFVKHELWISKWNSLFIKKWHIALHYPWSMKQDPSPGVWGRDVYQRLWVEVHQIFFKIHWQNLSRFQRTRIPESQFFLSVFLWTLIKFCLFSSLLAKLIRWTLKFQAKTCLESLWTLQIEYPFAFHNSPFLLWEQLLCLNAPEKTVRTIIVNETMLVLEQTTLSCWTVDAAADIPLLTFSHPLDKIRNGANKQCYEKTRRIFTACENLWFN